MDAGCSWTPHRFELRGDTASDQARIDELTRQLEASQERCRRLEADLERGEANRVRNCELRAEAQGQADVYRTRAIQALVGGEKLAKELEAWQQMHAEMTRERCHARVELELALTELRELGAEPVEEDEEDD
jgi:multidrug resistance efflux pump